MPRNNSTIGGSSQLPGCRRGAGGAPRTHQRKTVVTGAIAGASRQGFAVRYARARERGYQRLADELLELADADCTGPDGKPDNALVQQRRLQVDTRKWLLSKLLPKQYGDRVTAEVVGDANVPLLTRIELVAVPPRHPGVIIEQDRDEATATGPSAPVGQRRIGSS